MSIFFRVIFLGEIKMDILGLDIGVSSVGSAWVNTENGTIRLGVGIFPEGVAKKKDGSLGAAKNQDRREKRQQRKQLGRRSDRKKQLRKKLVKWGWIPGNFVEVLKWERLNPWRLRREALERELAPTEFGRVLLHLIQRRGASWFEDVKGSPKKKEENDGEQNQKKTPKLDPKGANLKLRELMKKTKAETYGACMSILKDKRIIELKNKKDETVCIHNSIRNRNNAEGNPVFEFCADRRLLIDEFLLLWERQKSFGGSLAEQLTDNRKEELYKSKGTNTWKTQGLLFGQRNTYWDTGTLGRCDLEPTDQCCPKADMYAQEFLVLETANNIRIIPPGQYARPLNKEERAKVIQTLETQKTASASTVRTALGLGKEIALNLEHDKNKKLNTNWFKSQVVAAIGLEIWNSMDLTRQNGVNKAILKFDPKDIDDKKTLVQGCRDWWGFDENQTQAFIQAWENRPKKEARLSLSRKAIQNLLPYMRQYEGCSVTEARQYFAEDGDNGATNQQRERYSLAYNRPNKHLRQYMQKHPDLLPPPPMIANPVVRKTIHEVRRQIIEHIRQAGGVVPEQIIVELTRDAKHSAVVRDRLNDAMKKNREKRAKIKKEFPDEIANQNLTRTQERKAIDRVILCRQQKEQCAYSNLDKMEARPIDPRQAARGEGLEIDHIIPQSRGGSNSLSNKVLCYAATNRGKGNKTLREWLGEDSFARMEQRFGHWKTDRELKRKWEILHTESLSMEDYIQNQLTDTAYAATQVIQWLQQALYGGCHDGKRHIFPTTGRYTGLLRKEWGLFYSERNPDAEEKSRDDHRHHALDAVVVAFSGPERIRQLAEISQRLELAHEKGETLPREEMRIPAPKPWKDRDSFRAQVIEQVKNLVVSHRPEKRKIVGRFHKETQYGPILDENGELTDEFTQRIFIGKLNPKNHLRVPEHWDTLREKLELAKTKKEKHDIQKQMLALDDVRPGKSGVVRDRWFREELRQCLRKNGLDPDSFSNGKTDKEEDKKHFRHLIREGKICLPSGVPIRQVTLRKVFNFRAEIPRKRIDPVTGKRIVDKNPKSMRVYELQSNHHIEIRENPKGKWVGDVIPTFDAVRRVRPPKAPGQKPRPAVDRSDTKKGKFIMSLCIGETVYMKHKDSEKPGYFVVFKVDSGKSGRIHFTHHWDAGKDKADETHPARADISLSPSQLQALGAEEGKPPVKVWVSPLGKVKVLHRD